LLTVGAGADNPGGRDGAGPAGCDSRLGRYRPVGRVESRRWVVAEEVQVRGTTVKIRNPLLVFVWSLVTLGIYYVVWYYKVNRELRDACGVTVNPLVAVLAVTIGWILIVPPFVSWYRTFTRIVEAQRNAGLTHEASPILGFILYVIAVFILPVELIYAQDELNKLWRAR
jgi:hypothetical protein